MDLERLRTFQVVCEEGSVSRAAVRLFRSQPAISMQLATLEAEAGTRLLLRNSRGGSPSPAGQRLLACAAELFRAYERLRDSWAGEDVGGDLHVASSDTIARHFLPPVLRELVRRRPVVRLHLVQSATPESQNRLRRGEVEVAFLPRSIRKSWRRARWCCSRAARRRATSWTRPSGREGSCPSASSRLARCRSRRRWCAAASGSASSRTTRSIRPIACGRARSPAPRCARSPSPGGAICRSRARPSSSSS